MREHKQSHANSFILPFLKKEQLAHNTYSFYFDRSSVTFDFFPGQYIRMTLPHKNPDDRGTSRYFTIASSPSQKNVVMFTVKIFQSSFKEALLRLLPGQPVQFFGPMGWFLLPEDETQEKVFIAGGIGITPFHSLLHSLIDQALIKPMTLFASFATSEEVLFYDSLQQISKKNKNIRVVYTVTKEEKEWQGEVGRITKPLLENYVSDFLQPVYYIVGSPTMVEGTKILLLSLGIAEEKIRTEDFTGY